MSVLTVVELKEKLRERSLSTTGTKIELLKRLLDAGVSHEELRTLESLSETCEEQLDESRSEAFVQTQTMPSLREFKLLRRERDLAARKAELLRRELDLLRTTPHLDVAVLPPRAGMKKWKELENLIGEFTGDPLNLDQWEKQVRKLLTSYELNDHQVKALVCNRLEGKVLKWFHSRVDSVELSCENLLQELRKMYGQQANPLMLRRKLEART